VFLFYYRCLTSVRKSIWKRRRKGNLSLSFPPLPCRFHKTALSQKSLSMLLSYN